VHGNAVLLAGTALTLLAFALLPARDAFVGLPLLWTLTVLAAIDVRTYRLPDVLTLPLLVAGILISVIGLGPSLISSSLGALVGYGALWLISASYRRLRGRDGLGLGDAKLLAALGAWNGVETLPYILLGAALLGLIWCAGLRVWGRPVQSSDLVPFGPFLSISGFGVFVATRAPIIATDLFQAVMRTS
jgi:leader peptidase (prepilin peptidase)/N-methyltransferase